ncbi:hypothetical protein SAMN05660485_03178 [Blastococcus fimeti]|nr:hypothetical protein SAMN05660485_03178 [Blastococcus fimeti]
MTKKADPSPTYPQAQGPDEYYHLLLDPADIPAGQTTPGSSLLDTNVVRNIRDYWRNPSGQRGVSLERLVRLRRGSSLGDINALWGAGERAWQRHTHDLHHEKFFEHVIAVQDFFSSDIDRIRPKTDEDVAELIAPSSRSRDACLAFEGFFRDIVESEIRPAFAVILKVHEILQLTGPAEPSALSFLDWLSVRLNWAPALEQMLGVVLLAPTELLNAEGRRLKDVAAALFKPGKKDGAVGTAAWGTAWDLAFLRVRRRMEQFSPNMLTTGALPPTPYRLVSNEAALIHAFGAIAQSPYLGDLVTVNDDLSRSIDGFVSDPWLIAGSALHRRMADFPMERARAMIFRGSIPAGATTHQALLDELERLKALFKDEWETRTL